MGFFGFCFVVFVFWVHSLTTCNLTCGLMQYTFFSPEGQELECYYWGERVYFLREMEQQ